MTGGEHRQVNDADISDADIIAASLTDRTRFEQIFDRYYDDIVTYLARRAGGDSAPDLAAEVFLRAFRDREKYDQTRTFARPWLMGIASNLLRDHYRREKRRMRAYLRAAGWNGNPVSYVDADSRVDAQRQLGPLRSALTRLRPADREVLLLSALADLNHEEIAAALGIPIGTVKSRLHRARRVIQARLEDDRTPECGEAT